MNFFLKKIAVFSAAKPHSEVKCKVFHHIFFWCLTPSFFLLSCQNPGIHHSPDDLVLSNFLNKSYIYEFGRKPYANELKDASSFFEKNRFTQSSREEYLMKVSASNEYKLYLYQLARNDLMNFIFNPDTGEIQNTINVWTRMYPNEYGRREIARLKKLKTISPDLLSGSLDNIGLQKRLVHNSYYDFINMGTENFVISIYNNFLDRSPTKYELTQDKMMVDSSDAVFLGVHGHSKEDFVALFFESYPYYEGQVRMLYKRYYFSEPSPEYLAYLTLEYYKKRDFRRLEAELLSLEKLITS